MAVADLLDGEDLKELQKFLLLLCPATLGLEGDGDRSSEALRQALETPDVSALLSTWGYTVFRYGCFDRNILFVVHFSYSLGFSSSNDWFKWLPI